VEKTRGLENRSRRGRRVALRERGGHEKPTQRDLGLKENTKKRNAYLDILSVYNQGGEKKGKRGGKGQEEGHCEENAVSREKRPASDSLLEVRAQNGGRRKGHDTKKRAQ